MRRGDNRRIHVEARYDEDGVPVAVARSTCAHDGRPLQIDRSRPAAEAPGRRHQPDRDVAIIARVERQFAVRLSLSSSKRQIVVVLWSADWFVAFVVSRARGWELSSVGARP